MTAKIFGELSGEFIMPMIGAQLGLSSSKNTIVGWDDPITHKITPATSYGEAFMSQGLIGVYRYDQQLKQQPFIKLPVDEQHPENDINNRPPDQIIDDDDNDIDNRPPDQIIDDDYDSDEEQVGVEVAQNVQIPYQQPLQPPNPQQPVNRVNLLPLIQPVVQGIIQGGAVVIDGRKKEQIIVEPPSESSKQPTSEVPVEISAPPKSIVQGLDRHDILRSTLVFK